MREVEASSNHSSTSAGADGGGGKERALRSSSIFSQQMWSQLGDWVDVKGSCLVNVMVGAVWSEPVGGRSFAHVGASARKGWLA